MSEIFWSDLATVTFNAMVLSMSVFVFASGLALMLGILKILNFAHSSFYAIGAYVVYTLVQGADDISIWFFALAVAAGGIVTVSAGVAAEYIVFRRIRDIDYHYSLIATYALLLLAGGVIKSIWGVGYKSVPTPQEIEGAITIGSIVMPWLSVFAIFMGIAIFLFIEYLLNRTNVGKLMQSVAIDPWMANALGINVPLIYGLIVLVSFALAGISGALLSPTVTLTPHAGEALALYAFGALVVGGMGNIRGTFVACIALCFMDTFASAYFHITQGIVFFLAIVAFLAVRPNGLVKGAGL